MMMIDLQQTREKKSQIPNELYLQFETLEHKTLCSKLDNKAHQKQQKQQQNKIPGILRSKRNEIDKGPTTN
jgi:hypothetical protein